MNARCFNDPLDPADDLCDVCGGEFCFRCLIHPGRSKNVVCKSCALTRSGIRGTSKVERKIDRRQARKRRQVLIQAREEREREAAEAASVAEQGEFDGMAWLNQPKASVEKSSIEKPSVEKPSEPSPKRSLRWFAKDNSAEAKEEADDDTWDVSPYSEDVERFTYDEPSPTHNDPRSGDPEPVVEPNDFDASEVPSAAHTLSKLRLNVEPPSPQGHPEPAPEDLQESPQLQDMPMLQTTEPSRPESVPIPRPAVGQAPEGQAVEADNPPPMAFDPMIDPFALNDVPSPAPRPKRPAVLASQDAVGTDTDDRDSAGNWIPPALRG